MLIKIKGTGGKWVLFDDVSTIEYGASPVKIENQQQLRNLHGTVDTDVEIIHIFPGFDFSKESDDLNLRVNTISFTKDGVRNLIVFSSVCYVCNNQGRTIEKVPASEKY